MNLKILNDRILVERLPEENQTIGGIIIPDTAKKKQARGKVIATGQGRVNKNGLVIPLEVKEGDLVIFSKYSGTDIKLDEREYLKMHESDILGVIE